MMVMDVEINNGGVLVVEPKVNEGDGGAERSGD